MNSSLHTVVGIGASSGGLEAIQDFFNQMPINPKLSFIIMQHLSPNYHSIMNDLLAHHTSMPIKIAAHNMPLEAGVIYLIPPPFEAEVKQSCFILNKINRNMLAHPINTLFTSLATHYQQQAIGIIFSGTGADGALGMSAIAEQHGLTLVQTPSEAKFPGMPNEAIATQNINFILSIAEMPDTILDYIEHPDDFQAERKQTRLIDESAYRELLNLLKKHTKTDFSLYKIGTISRRIMRRMSLAGIDHLTNYMTFLAHNPSALEELHQDLLIGVTEFFRDPSAFDTLKREVIPELFARFKSNPDNIRVWVAACSTGEEAYSVALLLKKYADDHDLPFAVKLIATDLSPHFISKAKKGRYSYAEVAAIPAELLNAYFIKNTDYYEIIPEIKRQILFVTHNALIEPPFTKLALICCRNLLIYIKPEEQARLLNLLQFSLNVGGFLFLGPSEGNADLKSNLTVINQAWKIFKKNQRSLPGQIAANTFSTALTSEPPTTTHALNHTESLPLFAINAILTEVVFAGFIIDTSYLILHSIGKAREMIILPEGKPTLVLPKIILHELKAALITALHKVKITLRPVVFNKIAMHDNHKAWHVKMSVHPICDKNQHLVYYWIRLDTIKNRRNLQKKIIISDAEKNQLHDEMMINLEKELSEAKSMLQSSLENIESVNEEMQSTNEELMASNEELQSTNEELQSVNEELNIVNSERARKIAEVIETKDDLDNLIRSAEIFTIILNAALEIRIFTPNIKKIFNLLDHDIGRSLENFKHNLKFEGLIDKAAEVYRNNKPYEAEISNNKNNYYYLLKIAPYHASNNHVATGVVINFFDINQLKSLQQEKDHITKELKLTLKTGLIGILHGNMLDQALNYDDTIKKIFGLAEHTPMRHLNDFIACIHPEDKKRVEAALNLTRNTQQTFEENFRIIRPNGQIRYVSCCANADIDSNSLTGICWDITEKYWLEEKIIDAEHLNLSLDAITDGWLDWDLRTQELYLSPLLKKTLGYADHELTNRMESYEELILPEDRRLLDANMQKYIAANSDEPLIQEIRFKHKSGHIVWILSHSKGILNKQGQLIRIVGTQNNITPLKENAANLEKLAYRDFLTQVPNKSAFLDNLARGIARSKRKEVLLGVMYLDIDDFKACNDQFGHDFGDAVLCHVANKLINASRTVDYIARLAGDEFGILLEDIASSQEILDIATRYLQAFNTPLLINNNSIQLTVSIGIALYPQHGETEHALLAHADKAMYHAKKQGKNQVVLL